MQKGLTHLLLLHLCSNYPPSDIKTTPPPPWQWIPGFPYENLHQNDTSFRCKLKNPTQLRNELLKGKKLRVATFPNQPPMNWVTIDNKTGVIQGHGISFEILNTLKDKYSFTYEIILPTKKTLLDQEGSIMNMLKTGKVDMVAAFVPILNIKKYKLKRFASEEEELKLQLQQEEAMKWKWGIELGQTQYVVLMKRPNESATGSGLLAPFEIEVWFLILISLALIGPIIHLIMRVRRYLCGNCSELYPISACTWFVYGALMKQGSTLNPPSDSTRVMFATWWIFIMILTAFYTANLTAFLTLSRFTLPIQSVDDIADPINSWCAETGGAVEYSIKEDGDLEVLDKSLRSGRGQFIDIMDSKKIIRMISNGILFLHDKHWLNFFMLSMERVADEHNHCTFVLTTDSYLTRSLSFVYPKHSILPPLFNSIMLSYVESGIIKHLLSKDLPEAEICPLDLGSKERQLRNSDLFTTYIVVISGFTAAFIVLLTERLSRRFCLSKISSDDFTVQNNLPYKGISILKRKSLENKIDAKKKMFNGTEYFIYKNQFGQKRMIPTRTPSAALFHRWNSLL